MKRSIAMILFVCVAVLVPNAPSFAADNAAVRLLKAHNKRLLKQVEALKKEIAELKAANAKLLKRLAEAGTTRPATKTTRPSAWDKPATAKIGVVGIELLPVSMRWMQAFRGEAGFDQAPPFGAGLVSYVTRGGPADRAGIKEHDLLCTVGGLVVGDARSLADRLAGMRGQKAIPFRVLRRQRATANGKKKMKWVSHVFKIVPLPRNKFPWEAGTCPLKLRVAMVWPNVIGKPTVILEVRNVSPQAVIAYDVTIHCFDRFDRPVINPIKRTNQVGAISQVIIKPDHVSGKDASWPLHFHDATAKVRIVLNQVRLQDGSTWKPRDGQTVAIEGKSPR